MASYGSGNGYDDQLDPIFHAAIDSGRVPGAAVIALDKDGNTLFSKGYGTITYGDPSAPKVTVQTPNLVFSCTKLVTSVAALQLLEQGKFALDDLVEQYVPEIKEIKILDGFDADGKPIQHEATNKPKIVHLFTHTTGFSYDFFDKRAVQWRAFKGETLAFYGLRSDFQSTYIHEPGTKYHYGINTDWLGFVIESVSGMKLQDYIQKNIIEPLGLKRIGVSPPGDDSEVFNVHMKDAQGNLTPNPALRLGAKIQPSGGGHYLYSSVEDYAQFLLTILNNGTHPSLNVTLLKPETVQKYIFTDQLDSIGASSEGVGVITCGLPPTTTTGEFLPGVKKGWSLALMTNSEDLPNGRKAGSGAWAGLGNSYYWMDPASGKLGVLSAGLFPFFDKDVMHLFDALERAVYGQPAAKEKGEPGSNFSGGEYVIDP